MWIRKFVGLGLLALLVFGAMGFVGMAGRSRSESAWMQGYLAGQQAAVGAEDGAATNLPPPHPGAYGYDGYYRGHRGFFPGVGLFFCLFPLFMFGGFFFLLGGRRRWRHGHGPWGEHGPHGRHHHHRHPHPGSHKPPWVDDADLADEPIIKA